MLLEYIDGESTPLVPLIWFPVSRRLPIIEDDEERHTRKKPLESVDLRLEDLLEDLSRYHSILNAQLSERYREFERQVLSVILFRKEHDQLKSIRNSVFHSPPTEAEKVDENGILNIKAPSPSELNWHLLSSGEKQILILLTQALLKFDKPVVYIADEPELSLHVTWQEKLLKSLVTLGGQMQVIVATHSPDIVGNFQDKVIDLGRKS